MPKPKQQGRKRRKYREWTEEDERQSHEAAKVFFDRLLCWWKLVTGDVPAARQQYEKIRRKEKG